jgi:hypothetical protein
MIHNSKMVHLRKFLLADVRGNRSFGFWALFEKMIAVPPVRKALI